MNILLNLVDSGLKKILVILITAMVACVSWQVFSRYVLNDPSSITEELARFLLMWISLLGACYAYRTRMHLGLDLVVNQFSEKYQHKASQFALIVTMVFSVSVMVVGGFNLAWIAWELKQQSAALNISMAWVYSVMPISGLIITFYAGFYLFNHQAFVNALAPTHEGED